MTADEASRGQGLRWPRRTWWAAAVLPAVFFCALYARALPYEFVWTDRTELVQGLLIRPPDRILQAFVQPMYPDLAAVSPGSVQSYYRPVKVVVASLVDLVWGRDASAFRAVSLVLGGLTYALLALLAGRLFGDPRAGGLVALLAAAHPAGIENYVWPSGIDDALAKLFIVASLLASVLAVRRRDGASHSWLAGLALLLLALALGSKESAAVTPALAIACLWVVDRGGESSRSTRLWLVGSQVVLVGAYFLILRPLVLGGVATGAPPIGDRYPLHLLTALATWPDRLAWTFLPLSSTTSDVVPVVNIVLQPAVVTAVLLVFLVPFAVWRLWRAEQTMVAFGLAWLAIAFLPASGLVPLTHLRADRYLALPAWGAAFVAAAVVLPSAGRVGPERLRKTLALVLGCLMIAGLASLTHARISDWRSDRVLFSRDLERDPFFREGRYVLAASHFEAGRYAEAREQLHELEAVNQRFGMRASYLRQDAAVSLLCRVNLALGLASETVDLLGAQIRPDSGALSGAPAFFLCGARSLEKVGRSAEALELYQVMHALPRIGEDPRVTLGLARVHARLGDLRAARGFLLRTPREVEGDPEYGESRRALESRLGRP
jgi:tetratricopeptide (TPR) repeat protein